MAAKRYRGTEHRNFHRAAAYTEGRSTKRSRDERALKRKSTWGQAVAAGEWAVSEWDALKRLLGDRAAGPLPGADRRHRDPDGVDHRRRGDRTAAGPDPAAQPALLASYFEQLREAMAHDGPARRGARRPLGVQHPRRRATGS